MRQPDENHFLFYRGSTFRFGCYIPPKPDQKTLSYDGFELRAISDEQYGGVAYVKKEGRIGIFLFEDADVMRGKWLFKADTFPFIFDEVLVPWYAEENDVYLAVRIGSKWGVIRLFDTKNYHADFKGWCVPWEHNTREEAIKAIRAKYDTSKLDWIEAI